MNIFNKNFCDFNIKDIEEKNKKDMKELFKLAEEKEINREDFLNYFLVYLEKMNLPIDMNLRLKKRILKEFEKNYNIGVCI